MTLSSSNQTPINDETLAIYKGIDSFRNSPEIYADIIARISAGKIAENYERNGGEELNFKTIQKIIEGKKFSILTKQQQYVDIYDENKVKYLNPEDYNLVPNVYRQYLERKLENTENHPLPLVSITEEISEKVGKLFDLVKKSV
ncbi:MAG: hypothetical protein PHR68_05185 [Candidatus Gracilibacteria bacterium]|nr:hypothetical protein [Candidatus Gracilibacteria bacterium]